MLATLLTVALLHWLVLLTPGVNVLLVSQLAVSGQRKSAFYAGLGISTMAVSWSLLAILGVNELFASTPTLRFSTQFLGTLYLCYVAIRLYRSETSVGPQEGKPMDSASAFRLGFVTNVLNPKSALFFGSLFAAILPSESSAMLLTVVTIVIFVDALIWHSFVALAFSHSHVQAYYQSHRNILNRAASLLFAVFGICLLTATVLELQPI